MAERVIGILKMPIGNLQSAWNAVCAVGFDPVLVDETSDFDSLSHLIMPGVGNFRAVVDHLESRGLPARVKQFARSGRPLLGICVGMQLLAETGSEGGESIGLGLIKGHVHQLPDIEGLRLPHVGWSGVSIHHQHPVLEGIKNGRDFYFVHSYSFQVAETKDLIAETTYGRPFASIVGRANVIGFQFHPEKSHVNGLRLVENFCCWDGRC